MRDCKVVVALIVVSVGIVAASSIAPLSTYRLKFVFGAHIEMETVVRCNLDGSLHALAG